MTEIEILNESVENILNIDKTFDLIYMDPPFGLQRDFKMLESDGHEKGEGGIRASGRAGLWADILS